MLLRSTCRLQTPETPHPVAPPPLVYGLSLGLGYLANVLMPLPIMAHPARWWGGGVLLALGVLLYAVSLRSLQRAGTTLHAERAASVLVTTGVYRFTRNPIYLAMSVVYLAVSLLFNSLWMPALLVPALLVMHFGVIKREEAHLTHQFGDRYRAYIQSVRRWL